jgi:hypothetical protein
MPEILYTFIINLLFIQILYAASHEPFRIVKKRNVNQSLRIHLVYDDSLNDLSKDKQHLVMVDTLFYWFSCVSDQNSVNVHLAFAASVMRIASVKAIAGWWLPWL